jgi:hypothetical protein
MIQKNHDDFKYGDSAKFAGYVVENAEPVCVKSLNNEKKVNMLVLPISFSERIELLHLI